MATKSASTNGSVSDAAPAAEGDRRRSAVGDEAGTGTTGTPGPAAPSEAKAKASPEGKKAPAGKGKGTAASKKTTTSKPRPAASKQVAPKQVASKPTASKDKEARKDVQRSYPRKTLEEALAIPLMIKEKNNGKPWRTEDVASACGYTHVRSGGFFYLSSAARDYNLTVGSYSTEKIEISELGTRIVYPRDASSERQAKIDAFFQVDVFKKVFDHYGGSKLPEEKYLSSTLEIDFGIAPDLQEEFVNLYTRNCAYLGIENGLGTNDKRSETLTADNADVRVVGQPKGKFDRTAFVIMPFSEKGPAVRPVRFFDEVLNSLITPAANQAGFAVETAQRHGSEVIQSTIINQLLQADLVVCDLTDHNPNVLFELGIRIARELPVALIRAEGTGPIFDVDHMLRVQSYSANLWTTTISTDFPKLAEHFKATWDNRSRNTTYMSILTAKQPAPVM